MIAALRRWLHEAFVPDDHDPPAPNYGPVIDTHQAQLLVGRAEAVLGSCDLAPDERAAIIRALALVPSLLEDRDMLRYAMGAITEFPEHSTAIADEALGNVVGGQWLSPETVDGRPAPRW